VKKQVVYIHGGDTWDSYESYLRSLKSEKAEREDFIPESKKRWRFTLAKDLGKSYEVFLPDMPNPGNAKYNEWKIWFEKLLPFLHKGPVFIGHSLGGIFLAKYFSENPDRKHAKGMLLVAPPFVDQIRSKGMADFVLPKSLDRLERLGPKVHLYHSDDDPLVSSRNLKRYVKALPHARVTTFRDREHFIHGKFPEIVKDIKAL